MYKTDMFLLVLYLFLRFLKHFQQIEEISDDKHPSFFLDYFLIISIQTKVL